MLYAFLGPGFPPQVLRVFASEAEREGESWCLAYNGWQLRCLAALDLSNNELFALPPGWELMRVDIAKLTGKLTSHGEVLNVAGFFYCRPHGAWEDMGFPFLHLWTMCAGRALRFQSFFDGIELQRVGRLEGCQAA